MNGTRLLMHAPGAPGLRLLGLGPGLRPTRGRSLWAQVPLPPTLLILCTGNPLLMSTWRGAEAPDTYRRNDRRGVFHESGGTLAHATFSTGFAGFCWS